MIVDAHLDLAHNVLDYNRDLSLPLEELRRRDPHPDIPVVTLPALREGGVGLCFATLFADPKKHPEPEEAHRDALRQLEVYRRWEDAGQARIVRSRADLQAHLQRWPQDHTLGLMVLVEGAGPIRQPGEVGFWKAQGVRLIGPAWNRNRYTGGTREPGPLTPLGVELVQAIQEAGLGLDLAHMDEEAFWQALEQTNGPVCATHANPRALLNAPESPYNNRHLSDPMIRAIGERNGVIGTVLFNFFLDPTWSRGQPRIPLQRVQAHLQHTAALIGWDKVGIGSDFDGGFGLNENPLGLDTPGDLAKLGDLVPPSARAGVLGQNWIRWLEGWL
ncbi:MAG: membrane dipeptidase [Thermaceae bacterium]|nr:membrane dipeptidase [Thermaceae bacterium]